MINFGKLRISPTVDQSLISDSDELNDVIDQLLDNYAQMEQTKRGKLE